MDAVHVILMFLTFLVGMVCVFSFDSNKEVVIGVVSLLVCVVLLVFFLVGSYKLSESSWVYPDEPYAVEKLVALNDNNMMNGRFYVRSGYIESDLWYQYIYESQSGGYKTNKIKADSATIFYDDDNYRVEWYERTKRWLYWSETDICHKIYIPEGSLTNTYSIDLQ